jgi:DNA-binding NarL/FixJ family response regulator
MRLVIADESPVFTRGLSLLLPAVSGRQVEVVASTDDASAVAATVRRHDPDVAVVSLGLSEPGGVRAIAATRRAHARVAIVAMSPTGTATDDVAALRHGANACLHKTDEPEELISALVAAVDGWAVVSPLVLAALLETAQPDRLIRRRLSAEEVDLWRLVASGLTTSGIATRLRVSERTAKRLIAALLRRLEVETRTEAARLAGAVRLEA